MAIHDDDVAAVKAVTDIVGLVSTYLPLRRVGRRFVGLCPFHGEKTPSFSVNAEQGLYYCFGCQRSGDAFTFVEEIEQVDFVGAVELLAHKAGVTLRYTSQGEGETRRRKTRLVEALSEAVAWYHERLLTSPDAAAARRYLRARGFDGERVRAFSLGWAPEGWDEAQRALGLRAETASATGLGVVSRGRVRDFFRARILFPIFDAQGDPVGFGGRLLPGATGPKYLNPGTTALYDKSKVLYGLNWAKTEAVTRGEVVVCEGYTDVIGFHQAGVARAVATCGTALTEDHVKLLTRFAKRVLLAFDADAAGRAAAERFHTWEQRYGIDVGVVSLPGGVDPADLAQRDPAALRDAVEHAVPFLSFRLDRLFADANLTTPEGRARAAQAALTVVEGHPDPLVREQYLLDVATRCRVEVASLDRLAAEARSAPVEGRTAGGGVGRRSADAPPPFPGGGPGGRRLPIDSRLARAGDGMRSGGGGASRSGGAVKVDRRPRIHPHNHERTALRLAADRPDLVVEWFDPVLFAEPLYRQAAVQLADAGTLAVALDTADAPVADILRQVAAEESDAQPEEVFLRLAHEAAVREVRMIQQATRGSIGPETKAAYVALTGWQGTLVDYERPEDERLQAGTELLTWLLDQAEERG